MHEIKLGQLVDDTAQRDAIHIAVAPVIAADDLEPGQPISFVRGSTQEVCVSGRPLGIVDPFLTQPVSRGQRFWMFLMPNTITSLRHEWTHPAFHGKPVAAPDKAESEAYLRAFAESAGLGYQRMLDIVRDYVEHDDVWVESGSENARDAFYAVDEDEFWNHFHAITGLVRPSNPSWGAPFSCSC